MATINGRVMIEDCSTCEFWSKHRDQGTCSQNIKTETYGLQKQITPCNHLCSLYEANETKFAFSLRIDGDDNIHISGNFTLNTLIKAKEFIDNKIEENK